MDEQNPSASSGQVPEPAPQPTLQPAPQPESKQEQSTTTAPKHNTLMAVLAYILFFIPLLTDSKDDPFVKFHVKQGLVLFIAYLVAAIVMRLPVIGWILMIPLNIFLFIVWLIGILNALGGKQKELPLIGKYASEFKF